MTPRLLPDVVAIILSYFAENNATCLADLENAVQIFRCGSLLPHEHAATVLRAWISARWHTPLHPAPRMSSELREATVAHALTLKRWHVLDLLDLPAPSDAWGWMATVLDVCGLYSHTVRSDDERVQIANEALCGAAEMGNLSLVKVLVEVGGAYVRSLYETEDPDHMGEMIYGTNAADVAIECGEVAVARYLWNNKEMTRMTVQSVKTLFYDYDTLCRGGALENPEMIDFLVSEMNADYTDDNPVQTILSDEMYGTALHIVRLQTNTGFSIKCLEKLVISALKDRNVQAATDLLRAIEASKSKEMPTMTFFRDSIMEIAKTGFVDGLNLLIDWYDRQSNVYRRYHTIDYESALRQTVEHGHLEATRRLLRAGASVGIRTLRACIRSGKVETLVELMPHLQPHSFKYDIRESIEEAIKYGRTAMIPPMLEYARDECDIVTGNERNYLSHSGIVDIMNSINRAYMESKRSWPSQAISLSNRVRLFCNTPFHMGQQRGVRASQIFSGA
jgi:hypothetical protein